MVRIICWLLMKTLYRLRSRGGEHVPATGPALIACNHTGYLDGWLLIAACSRKIRFVIEDTFVNRGLVGWVLRNILGAVAMPRGGPKAMRASLDIIANLLKQGEVVGIFPEAYPTRCGTMLPFKRGIERLAKDNDVPIVPACIDRMWGSVWSYFGGKLFWKWSHRGSGPVRVFFGPPLPSTATASQARAAVQVLLADAAKERAQSIRPAFRTFVRNAARHPFRRCLTDTSGSGRALNYGKTYVAAACLKGVLRPLLGTQPLVGVWLPSSTGGVLANLGLCLMGKTAVNLNYTAGADAVRSAVRQCKITHILTSRRFLTKMPLEPIEGVQVIELESLLPQVSRWAKLAHFLKIVVFPGWLVEVPLRGVKAGDLATIIFSSGSTGEGKGIMLTHGNIAANVDAFIEHAEFTSHDRVLGTLPFFHSLGYTVTLWGPLCCGASALYWPDPRQAKEVGDLAKKEKCTLMAATATFLRFYLRRCHADDFKSMRLIACGAEKLPVSLANEFLEKFGVLPLEGYGCTETSPVVSVNMNDVTIAGLKQVRNKPGTIGHPLPGVACRIVHPETGELQGEDIEGLLHVTGPNIMLGYLNKPEQTAQAIRDDWYDTGDVGKIDADGFITLTGRLSRFAKVGGEMVPLERIEDDLHQVACTTDRVFAVTALPDEKKGERIVVLHVPLPAENTLKNLIAGLKEKGLPNLWIPGERDFYQVEAMPILGSGKLDLRKLKQLALDVVT